MTQAAHYDVAIIGAGIVGVCCAAWLQRAGKRVVLIDRDAPGSAASSGNAGTIATHACIPVNSPSLPLQLPGLLLGANNALALNAAYVLSHMPWMLRFLRNCTPERVERTIAGLASILRQTDAGLQPLIKQAGLAMLMRNNGYLYVYRDDAEWRAGQDDIARKRAAGARIDYLAGNAVGELEPTLAGGWSHGVLFPDYQWTTNPKTLTQQLAKHIAETGGDIIRASVTAIERTPASAQTGRDGARGELCLRMNQGHVLADQVVLAAGAWSTRIGGNLVEKLPLDTERGYHVMFPGAETLLTRPACWPAAAFYVTPMTGGLRSAGTVEIAGLDAPATKRRLSYLERKTREMLPVLGVAGETWLGFRPTLPDALPVIGRSRRTPEIILAFGHQHLGLTLAGITGKLVAEIADDRLSSLDLSPFSPRRFTTSKSA